MTDAFISRKNILNTNCPGNFLEIMNSKTVVRTTYRNSSASSWSLFPGIIYVTTTCYSTDILGHYPCITVHLEKNKLQVPCTDSIPASNVCVLDYPDISFTQCPSIASLPQLLCSIAIVLIFHNNANLCPCENPMIVVFHLTLLAPTCHAIQEFIIIW